MRATRGRSVAPGEVADPSRREVLKAGIAAGSALLLGFHIPLGEGRAMWSQGSAHEFAPNAFIRIDRQGRITLIMPQVEMGQGVYTSVPMILAEELDAAFEQVTVLEE